MTDYVLTVCLDGIPEGHEYNAIEETIEATGEAICRYEEEPEKIVTILLSEKASEHRAGQKPRMLDAEAAAHILFGSWTLATEDFDPSTAQFRSGADVCESLAAYFKLSEEEYLAIAKRVRQGLPK